MKRKSPDLDNESDATLRDDGNKQGPKCKNSSWETVEIDVSLMHIRIHYHVYFLMC